MRSSDGKEQESRLSNGGREAANWRLCFVLQTLESRKTHSIKALVSCRQSRTHDAIPASSRPAFAVYTAPQAKLPHNMACALVQQHCGASSRLAQSRQASTSRAGAVVARACYTQQPARAAGALVARRRPAHAKSSSTRASFAPCPSSGRGVVGRAFAFGRRGIT